MRSQAVCPKCRKDISLEDVNVATDIALCRQCGQTWSYGDLIAERNTADLVIRNPPAGTWLHETSPSNFEIGITTRSAEAFFIVPFMCVWSGFSLGGIYGMQIKSGHFNIFLSLFGIPFILGTLLMGSRAIMTVCGKMVVQVEGDQGVIFTGTGSLGWRRRFDWRQITAIRREERCGRRGTRYEEIVFAGEKRLRFGAGIKEERLDFLFGTLRRKWRESGR